MEKSSARWWDMPSAVFLFLAILFSAWRLQSTNWTEGLEHVRNVALLGLLVGLALGSSIYQKRGVTFLAISYMLVIFIWQWLGAIEFAKEEPIWETGYLIRRQAVWLEEFLRADLSKTRCYLWHYCVYLIGSLR
jgi:hypothetical protein